MAALKEQMFKSVLWLAVQKYASVIISLVVTMVMARNLTPKDFGVVAIALVVISFLSILSGLGIGPAIIQKKELTSDDLSHIYTFTFYLGFFLSILLFLFSGSIGDYYESEDLNLICKILCTNVFFGAINMVPNALMSRDKRFKEMAKITVVLSFITGILSIVAVLCGLGVFSLIISPIITSIGIYFYNIHFYPLKLFRHFSYGPLRKIMSYSLYTFAFNFIGFFSAQLDKLIIGRLLSQSSLGYYERAQSLVKQPIGLLTNVFTPVMHPYMSDYQNDFERMESNHNVVVKLLSTICLPTAVIFWFCGVEIIHLFYGAQWDASIATFKIFALILPTNVIISTSGAFWQATNSTRLLFFTGFFNSVFIICGYIVSANLFGTIEAIAWSYVITSVTIFFITYYIMYHFVFKKPFSHMLILFLNPIGNALLLVACYYAFEIFPIVVETPLIKLFFKLIIGIFLSLLYIQLTKRIDLLSFILTRTIRM